MKIVTTKVSLLIYKWSWV